MEDLVFNRAEAASYISNRPGVGWRDLREWLALVERNGELKRIDKPVDADEELAAITYMATRNEDAPALLFENIAGDRSGARVLVQHAGREQGALCARGRPRSRTSRSPR